MIKHLILLKIQNNYRYKRGLASVVYTFFEKKKSSATAATRADKSAVESEIISNQHLTKELH